MTIKNASDKIIMEQAINGIQIFPAYFAWLATIAGIVIFLIGFNICNNLPVLADNVIAS